MKAVVCADLLFSRWLFATAAGNNASKYRVMLYFYNNKTPRVINGIKWTVGECGYPYISVMGMIEVSPIKEIIKNILENLPEARKGRGISAGTPMEEKGFGGFRRFAAVLHVKLDMCLVMACFSNLRCIKKVLKTSRRTLPARMPIHFNLQTHMTDNASPVGYYIINNINKVHADQ